MIIVGSRRPSALPGGVVGVVALVLLVVGADVMDLGAVAGDRVLDGRFHGPRPRARARTSRLHPTRTLWETPGPFSRPFTGPLMGHSLANSELPVPRPTGQAQQQVRTGVVVSHGVPYWPYMATRRTSSTHPSDDHTPRQGHRDDMRG